MELNFLLFLIFIVLLFNLLLNLKKNFPEILKFEKLYLTSYICIMNIILAIFFLVYSHKSYYIEDEIYLIILYSFIYFFLNNKFNILRYSINYIFGIPYIILTDYTVSLFKTGELFLFLVIISFLYTFYQMIKYKEYRMKLIISIIVFCLFTGIILFLENY